MKAPHRIPAPTGTAWLLEATIAGQVLGKRFAGVDDATKAFHALARRCARGGIDRVVLWHGSACIDVAVPGAQSAKVQVGSTQGLDSLRGAGGGVPTLVTHAQVPPGTPLAALSRVCHCGKPVHEFMEKCEGCPGWQGAGKVLASGRRTATVASAEDLGL
jgi:hypothetical protein